MKLANGVEIPKVEVLTSPVPFPPQHVHPYLVLGDEPILVDTGVRSEAAWIALGKELKGFGLEIKDIRHILVTHAHLDHFGQAKRIKDVSGCKVYANRLEIPQLERRHVAHRTLEAPYLQFFREWGAPDSLLMRMVQGDDMSAAMMEAVSVDVPLEDGVPFTAGGVKFRPVWVPGHAIGHMVYIVDDWRVMFSADHLLPDISPVPLLNFPDPLKKEKTRSYIDFLASLDKVENEKIQVAFPSHGDPILDHRELIAGYRLHGRKRSLKVLRILSENPPLTAFEVAKKMFGDDRAQMLVYLVLSEAVGHLELLEQEGKIRIERRGELLYYSADSKETA
ncbi:MAG: MBL fold metallo-hydrolase [Bdellovibrionota bacterium]